MQCALDISIISGKPYCKSILNLLTGKKTFQLEYVFMKYYANNHMLAPKENIYHLSLLLVLRAGYGI